jgi:hypothetical protein
MNRKMKTRILLPFLCLSAVALAGNVDAQSRRYPDNRDSDRYGDRGRWGDDDYDRDGRYGRDSRDRYDRYDRDRYGRNDRYNNGNWTPYPDARGCIGGAKCGRYEEIRVRLQDRPVEAIRFRAHDNVGNVSRGHLRVEIDGRQIERDIDVAKNGDYYEIDGRGLRGRTLAINSFAHDEVEVDQVEVLYRGGGGWRR